MEERGAYSIINSFSQRLHNLQVCLTENICINHPFNDGNKRVGLVSTLIFLDLNDYSIEYDANKLEKLTLSVAEGKKKKEEISTFLSRN